MTHITSTSAAEAEVIALRALHFLAEEPPRLKRFLDLSGTAAAQLREIAGDAAFLGGVLDHLLADQSLLLAFAAAAEIDPRHLAGLRDMLPGAGHAG